MTNAVSTLLTVLVVAVLVFVIAFGMAIPVKLLWNWLMPDIFALPEITYWQAWGLYVLSSILLKSSVSSSGKES